MPRATSSGSMTLASEPDVMRWSLNTQWNSTMSKLKKVPTATRKPWKNEWANRRRTSTSISSRMTAPTCTARIRWVVVVAFRPNANTGVAWRSDRVGVMVASRCGALWLDADLLPQLPSLPPSTMAYRQGSGPQFHPGVRPAAAHAAPWPGAASCWPGGGGRGAAGTRVEPRALATARTDRANASLGELLQEQLLVDGDRGRRRGAVPAADPGHRPGRGRRWPGGAGGPRAADRVHAASRRPAARAGGAGRLLAQDGRLGPLLDD